MILLLLIRLLIEKNRGLYFTINGGDSASSIFEQIRTSIHPHPKEGRFLLVLFKNKKNIYRLSVSGRL
tara:strand:- start:134 stop:337 length:204 start_codon:yes stop_codon:yes gene_type:complete